MKDLVGQRFGDYRLIQSLGHDNFADTYLGEHIHNQTEKATIKVLASAISSRNQQKFLEGAQATKTLKNDHIAEILEVGIDKNSSLPFIVMQYAPGGTLAQRYPYGVILPIATILPYVKQIATALQYAHDQGITHGAINPGNILIGPNNTLLLSDFGIDTIFTGLSSPNAPKNMEMVHYQAPEQIQGNASFKSDQYALAAVIYQWLCGAYPFEGTTLPEIEQKSLTEAFPPSMRAKIPTIPAQIEQAVLKALAKNPLERFKNIQVFRNALELSSLAYTESLIGRKFSPPPILPKSQLDDPTRRIYGHSKAVSDVAWSPDGGRLASASLDGIVKIWGADLGDTLRTYKVSYPQAQSEASVEALPYTVTWSPDGKLVALSDVFGIVIVDSATGYPIQTMETMSGELFLTLNGISTSLSSMVPWILSVSYRSANFTAWSLKREFVPKVAWSPDGKRVAFTDGDTVKIWDMYNKHLIFSYRGHTSGNVTMTVAWSPDGEWIASSDPREVLIWNTNNGELASKISMGGVTNISWSPNLQQIACGISNNQTKIWNITEKKEIKTYKKLFRAKWSPDGNYIALINPPNIVEVYDVTAEKLSMTYDLHPAAISAIAWAPDNSRVASASLDGTVRVWQAI